MMMPTLAVATAHAFVLTVSHGLLFRQPPLTATALLPPLLSISPDCVGRRRRRSNSPLFVSDLDSSSNVTSSINRASSAMLPAEFQYCYRRAPSWWARTHQVSRSKARSEFGDPICRPIRLFSVAFFLPDLRCRPLGESCSGCSGQRGALIPGRFRGRQASRFRPTFQVLFCPVAFCQTCNSGL